jgi:hypothetical protein
MTPTKVLENGADVTAKKCPPQAPCGAAVQNLNLHLGVDVHSTPVVLPGHAACVASPLLTKERLQPIERKSWPVDVSAYNELPGIHGLLMIRH